MGRSVGPRPRPGNGLSCFGADLEPSSGGRPRSLRGVEADPGRDCGRSSWAGGYRRRWAAVDRRAPAPAKPSRYQGFVGAPAQAVALGQPLGLLRARADNGAVQLQRLPSSPPPRFE